MNTVDHRIIETILYLGILDTTAALPPEVRARLAYLADAVATCVEYGDILPSQPIPASANRMRVAQLLSEIIQYPFSASEQLVEIEGTLGLLRQRLRETDALPAIALLSDCIYLLEQAREIVDLTGEEI